MLFYEYSPRSILNNFLYCFCVTEVTVLAYTLQHIPVSQVPNGMGSCVDGRFYPGVPIRVSLALLAAAAQCLRLIQIPGTCKYGYKLLL